MTTSPLRPLLPTVAIAGVYALTAITWIVGADMLPGGRWMAVHLFTVGVLSNLVVGLTHHFAQTLLHAPRRDLRWGRCALLNTGALLLVVALPAGLPVLVAGAASVLTVAVLWLYVDLRRLRRNSLPGRFSFVVRGYERACGAFVHGALLGALMGTGALRGAWYPAARIAHLHVNVLGWGGLTLLATVVFFGPTIMRTRIEDGADISAATALPIAATGLTVGALALLLTGAGGSLTLPSRLLAAAGLAAYAGAASAVCVPVLRAARRAHAAGAAWMLGAACVWFVAAAWADVLVIASGRTRLLDALGVLLVVGVLAQAILAALGHLGPMMWAGGSDGRAAARERVDALALPRALAFNLGVLLVAVAAIAGPAAGSAGSITARVGWALVIATTLAQILLMTIPARPVR